MIAQRERDARLVDDGAEFPGTQQRHGRDRDTASLDHRQIGGDHHRGVRCAQQHPVAGDHAELPRQHIGDAVHALGQVGVGPASRSANSGTDARHDRRIHD